MGPRRREGGPLSAPSGRLPRLPQTIGPYDVLEPLGQGGMGVVVKARHRELDLVRAVKLVTAVDERARARFEREVRTLAAVRHPNVVRIHEAGALPDDRSWFAMDLVEGEPLDRVIERGGALPLDRAVAAAVAIARGVGALHAAGVVHRDLKPQNVVLTTDGTPVVLDLGLAVAPDKDERLTRTGAVLGTLAYMAPEGFEGAARVGPPADVYALGLLAFELLTGRSSVPEGSSTHEVTAQILAADRPRPSSIDPDLPVGVDEVVGRATARDPARRFADATAFADALEAARAGGGPSRRRVRARRALLAGLAGAALVVVALAAALAARPRHEAQAIGAQGAGDDGGRGAREAARLRREGDAAFHELKKAALPADRHAAAAAFLERFPDHPRAAEVTSLRAAARREFPVAVVEGPGRKGVRALFLRPADGEERVLEVGDDGVARAWRLATTGPVEAGRHEVGEPPRGLAATPDRRRVAVGRSRDVLVFDGATLAVEATLPAPGVPTVVALSPDGRRLAVGTVDHKVSVVDVATGQVRPLRDHNAQLRALAFSADGLWLVTGCGYGLNDKTAAVENMVRIFRLEDGHQVRSFDQPAMVTALAAHPSGPLVALGGNSFRLTLIDTARAEEAGEMASETDRSFMGGFAAVPPAHDSAVACAVFTPDGRRLLSCSGEAGPAGNQVKVWDVATKKGTLRIDRSGELIRSLDASPDGTLLLFTAGAKRIEVWTID